VSAGFGKVVPPEMPLTDLKIKNLKPKDKAYKIADFDGLFVLVTANGSKLFRFKYRVDGKEGLLSFGKYPAVSLSQARLKRDEARKLVAAGISPSIEHQEAKALRNAENANSFEKIAALYLAKITIEGRAPATLKKFPPLSPLQTKILGGCRSKIVRHQHLWANLAEFE